MTTEKLEFQIIPQLQPGEVLVVHVDTSDFETADQIKEHLAALEADFNRDSRYADNQLWFVASKGNTNSLAFEVKSQDISAA